MAYYLNTPEEDSSSLDLSKFEGLTPSSPPAFVSSANLHNIANGQASIEDQDSWNSHLVYGSMAAVTRAATSTWNMIPGTASFFADTFGADEFAAKAKEYEIKTDEVLEAVDSDAAAYYNRNAGVIDFVADTVVSLVPGVAAVRALNYTQRALAASTRGGALWGMARSFGTLVDRSDELAKVAARKMAANPNIRMSKEVAGSFAAGYAQSALEGAAFTAFASVTMHESESMFAEQDFGDLVYNSLTGGGLIGAGVFGSVLTAQTWTKLKKATDIASRERNAVSYIPELSTGLPAYAKVMSRAVSSREHAGTKYAEEFLHLADQKSQVLDTSLRKEVNGLLDSPDVDKDIGEHFTNIIKSMNDEQLMVKLPKLTSIARGGATTAAEKADPLGMKVGVQYLVTRGEGAGSTMHTTPEVLSLGDKYSKEQITQKITDAGFRFHPKEAAHYNPLDASVPVEKVELRKLWARGITREGLQGAKVGATDFDLLDRAITLGVQELEIVSPTGSMKLSGLENIFKYVKDTKTSMYAEHMKGSKSLKINEIATRLNVKASYLEGNINELDEVSDIIADGKIKTAELYKPKHMKLVYDVTNGDAADNLLKGDVEFQVDAASYLKMLDKVQHQANLNVTNNFMDTFFGEKLSENFLDDITEMQAVQVTRSDSGAGIASFASAAYGSPGAMAESTGKGTHRMIAKGDDKVMAHLTSPWNTLKEDGAASKELMSIYDKVRKSEGVFVKAPPELGADTYISSSLASAIENTKAKGGDLDALLQSAGGEEIITVTNKKTKDFLDNWIGLNDEVNTHRGNINAVTGVDFRHRAGALYFPGPNPDKYTHHAFVIDESVTGTGHVSMIHAKSAAELSELANKVPAGKGLRVVYQGRNQEYFKAKREYNSDLGINENYINTQLKKSGVSGSFFPTEDVTELGQELFNWRTRSVTALSRDMVALRYSKYFKELERLGDEATAVATSKKGDVLSIRNAAEGDISNPYRDVIRTSLAITKEEQVPAALRAFNDLGENVFRGLRSTLSGIFSSATPGPDKLDSAAAAIQQAGLGNAYKEAALDIFKNHPAGEQELTKFVVRANSLLTKVLLGTDPMNAVNNGLGHQILLWSESRYLVNGIKKNDPEIAGQLAKLMEVPVPGTGGRTIKSPAKMIGNAYKAYYGVLRGDKEALGLLAEFKKKGFITDTTEQLRQMFEELSIKGDETPSKFADNLSKALAFAEKWSGNQLAEEMNRFVSAYAAKTLTDAAVAARVLPNQKAADVFINTFVNRTNGNTIASQRPLLFNGPVGKAIGLFQSYQFNMLQHLFRHAGSDKKQMFILGGLQGSIYGMNGLPAFQAVNQYIVGSAAGNQEHVDITGKTFEIAGKEVGEWLLYGASSNMLSLLHPDLKTNLHTRGDINPRHVTIVPTNIEDIPIVAAPINALGSLYNAGKKIIAGGDISEAILQGIEHSQISRPLTGLAVVAQGHSTTSQGNIVAQNDLMSLGTLSRVLGARPLDEAIAREAHFRINYYESREQAKLKVLGGALKSKVTSGEPVTEEDVNDFLTKYVEAGGNQKQFMKYWNHQVRTASSSQIDQLLKSINNPYAQYMQRLLGGSTIFEE